jgi:glycine cleavage system H protein
MNEWRRGRVADYEIPNELLYTEEDEWIRREDGQLVIGVTDFAQNQLGEIVFVELPEVGTRTQSGTTFGTIESVKAVSDLYAPLSGEVLAANQALEDAPEKVNESCYGDGWLITLRIDDEAELEALLDADRYRQSVAERDT